MATFTACILTENSKDIIRYSLTYPLKHYEEVIIVDGGSTDGTVDLCKKIAKELGAEKKLRIYVNQFEHFQNQRNFYLARCTTDFIHVIDHDEVYLEKSFDIIRNLCESFDCLLINSVDFFVDFWHFLSPRLTERKIQVPKVFKNIRGKMNYKAYDKNTPEIGDQELYIEGVYFRDYFDTSVTKVVPPDVLRYFHYGAARGKRVEKEKQLRLAREFMPPIKPSEREELVKKSVFFSQKIWKDFTNPDKNAILTYSGAHPEIMLDHPDYWKRQIR